MSAFLLSCGGGIGSISLTPPAYTLSVSPQPVSVAAGASVTFTATTNAPSVSEWIMVGTSCFCGNPPAPATDAGSLTSARGDTVVYTAPATPPIYTSTFETDGTATVRALAGVTSVDTTFTITAPSITTGFSTPASTSVALGGGTLVVYAYAVGSVNNALTLQVNGVTGGSTSVGTIVAPAQGLYGEYIYTAPATMPMTGNTVTLTVISQADPTKSSTLTLTLH